MSAGDLERTEAASALRSQTASYTEINNTLCVLQHLILKCIVNVQFRADVQCITSAIVIFHRDIWRTFFFRSIYILQCKYFYTTIGNLLINNRLNRQENLVRGFAEMKNEPC